MFSVKKISTLTPCPVHPGPKARAPPRGFATVEGFRAPWASSGGGPASGLRHLLRPLCLPVVAHTLCDNTSVGNPYLSLENWSGCNVTKNLAPGKNSWKIGPSEFYRYRTKFYGEMVPGSFFCEDFGPWTIFRVTVVYFDFTD